MTAGQASVQPIAQSSTTINNNPQSMDYSKLLKPTAINAPMKTFATLPLKPVEFLHGEPVVKWKKQEVKQSIVQQGLLLAVLGKFSYGKHVISELRKVIPIQCEIKGHCSAGLIEDNHMHCSKWNPWWTPNEETPIAIAWISFPELPPNFFRKECVFSLTRAVGNPLHVDLATQNGTRPSCAKVKVEVNLLSKFPHRIKIVEEADESGPEKFKWIRIKYDYMPKYCKPCKKTGA
ncbi:uncharacterized protein [Nicotiana tomentosiformis]|uniref:uncharacterized protein n=1 Tax=Nicotiana tomentosiformis TaxID=4098 RepID=UPI00388CA8EA